MSLTSLVQSARGCRVGGVRVCTPAGLTEGARYDRSNDSSDTLVSLRDCTLCLWRACTIADLGLINYS